MGIRSLAPGFFAFGRFASAGFFSLPSSRRPARPESGAKRYGHQPERSEQRARFTCEHLREHLREPTRESVRAFLARGTSADGRRFGADATAGRSGWSVRDGIAWRGRSSVVTTTIRKRPGLMRLITRFLRNTSQRSCAASCAHRRRDESAAPMRSVRRRRCYAFAAAGLLEFALPRAGRGRRRRRSHRWIEAERGDRRPGRDAVVVAGAKSSRSSTARSRWRTRPKPRARQLAGCGLRAPASRRRRSTRSSRATWSGRAAGR